MNDFVPYEIKDESAELLLCLTLNAFEEFKELPGLFSKLSAEIRKLKSEGKEDKAAELEKWWVALVKEMNKAGMRFFKELTHFMKETELNDSSIRPFFLNFKKRIKTHVKGTAADLRKLLKDKQ